MKGIKAKHKGECKMQKDFPPMEDMPQMLRAKQIAQLLGVHVKTIAKWAEDGRLPKAVRLGARCKAWPKAEILAFIQRRMEESRV